MDEKIKKDKIISSDKLKKLFKNAIIGKKILIDDSSSSKTLSTSSSSSFMNITTKSRSDTGLRFNENRLRGLNRRKRNQSFSTYISIERKTAKRNLLDGIYISEEKIINSAPSFSDEIKFEDPEKTNQYNLLKNLCGNQIREIKELYLNEDSIINKYNEYDLYFLLKYYGKNFDIFDKKYIQVFDKYLFNYVDNNLYDNFDLSSIRKFILPKLFSLPLKYLLSYFYLCLNKDHYSVQSVLCKSLSNIDKNIKIYTVSQYDNLFMNNVLNKDDIIYLLLNIYDNQKTGNIQTSDLYPDVIAYFF